ncbi:MAG TPA: GNAT family protein [Actinophytocola sp.]|uniref:GNAT family N-acetyltransferase n=1 Tax=Actinophytocola sp. TaxID=1872138 RepID=UPI002DB9FBBB|nr:GNAT family protein [Actinophytocola sp.]HEU5470993.1 GNAT family protein [Actinophytocola sp.]
MAGRRERIILATDLGIAMAEYLDGDEEAVDAASDLEFMQDPDDRPVPFQFDILRVALIEVPAGRLIGVMWWYPIPYGPTLSRTSWNIGIKLISEARGRRHGARAARLLVRYLFDTTEVDRVQATTEEANLPGLRGLELAGFRREGILRGITIRGGERRDMVLYGLLRSDLEPDDDTDHTPCCG